MHNHIDMSYGDVTLPPLIILTKNYKSNQVRNKDGKKFIQLKSFTLFIYPRCTHKRPVHTLYYVGPSIGTI